MKKGKTLQKLVALVAVCILLVGLAACGGGKEAQKASLSDYAGYWRYAAAENEDYIMVIDGKTWVEYDPEGILAFEGTLTDKGDGTSILDEVDLGEYGTVSLSSDRKTMTFARSGGDTSYEYSKTDKSALEKVTVATDGNPYVGLWQSPADVTSLFGFYDDGTFIVYEIENEDEYAEVGKGTYDAEAGTLTTEDGVSTNFRIDNGYLYIAGEDGEEYEFTRISEESDPSSLK